MHPGPQFDGTEPRSASDSPPQHCPLLWHTGFLLPDARPIGRIEAGRRRRLEGSARPSAENLSLVRSPEKNRRTCAFRPGRRSIVPSPLAIVEKSSLPTTRLLTIPIL